MLGGAGALFGLSTYVSYQRDIRLARERVAAGGRIVQTACGPVEYGKCGDGSAAGDMPILVLHGAGGGYDQALLVGCLMVSEKGYPILAPSRFGYLGSPIPNDSSIEAQADAYACLLDALGVERALVVAISAGGPSGLHFALRHPRRTAALVTVSAITFGGVPEAEVHWHRTWANWAMESDFLHWLGSTVARFVLRSPGLAEAIQLPLTPRERVAMEQMLKAILPLSDRLAGTHLDRGRRLPPDAPLDRISAPTLVIHARNDPLVGFAHAEHAAAKIPGAELMAFDTGGHYMLGRYDEIETRVMAFLAENG
jgi:2-hydroxy-6-oxonona-2,4-dienedioate hydrolase